MNVAPPTDARRFTIEEANNSLPLVRSIMRDIVDLSRSMMTRRELLNQIQHQRSEDENDIYRDELNDVEDCLKADAEKLKGYVEELAQLHVQLRSLSDGEVAFPSIRDKRSVYLSWRYDEPKVAFWHELNESVDMRRPLDQVPNNRIASPPVVGPERSTG